jgi:hypothetical protein
MGGVDIRWPLDAHSRLPDNGSRFCAASFAVGTACLLLVIQQFALGGGSSRSRPTADRRPFVWNEKEWLTSGETAPAMADRTRGSSMRSGRGRPPGPSESSTREAYRKQLSDAGRLGSFARGRRNRDTRMAGPSQTSRPLVQLGLPLPCLSGPSSSCARTILWECSPRCRIAALARRYHPARPWLHAPPGKVPLP